VSIRQDDYKGKIEQAYAIKDSDTPQTNYDFGAVFSSGGQAVLFGNMDGCVLVWDKDKGDVVVGLDHGKGENDNLHLFRQLTTLHCAQKTLFKL
jgi:hypothetical protein